MSDKKITLKFDANSSSLEKKLKSVGNKLKKFGLELRTLADLGSIASGIGAVIKGFDALTKGVKRAAQEFDEMGKLYNAQVKAEKQLETAARNNPYLNNENVFALKNFAAELQNISTYGDEQLLPFMAQLASAGRTQSEIMEIMGAAVDVAAGGIMSLDTAVSSLNKTYSGSVGQLGNQVAGLKNLTKEQLKNGEAVRIVAESYKGMAEEVAKATGSREQLQNAMGDLKEELGAPFEKAMSPLRQFFTELISGWTNALAAKRKYKDAVIDEANGTADGEDYAVLIEKAEERLNKAVEKATKTRRWFNQTWQDFKNEEEAIKFYENALARGQQTGSLYFEAKEIADARSELEMYRTAFQKLTKEEQDAVQERIKQEKAEKQAEAQKLKMDRRDDLRKSYADAIEQEEARIDAEERAGKKITESEKAQRLYNVALQEYVKMMSDPAFDRSQTATGMWEGEAEQLKQIAGYASAAFDAEGARGKFASFFPDRQTAEQEVAEYYRSQMDALQSLYDSLPEEYQASFAQDFADAGERLARAQKEAMEKVHAEEREELYSHLEQSLSIAQDFISRYAEITAGIADIIGQNAEAAATSQTLALERQYAAGEVSAEEYEDTLSEIERRRAQESYRAQMWQWTASLAQATANTAQAVIATLADATLPTAARIAMSAVIGAAGAMQLATVIGSKPIPPSFSTGGIVGGTSYYGDRISANLNSGEMVLNRAQQRRLFDGINSGAINGSVTNRVTIKNYASPEVSASVQQGTDGLKVFIRKTVAEQMERGDYNRQLALASAGMSGEKYTS